MKTLSFGIGAPRSARKGALVAASVQPIRELWLPLLLGAFSLLVVELMLTRFWSEGRHA